MNPRTADPDVSIWRDLPEDTFRKHMVDLEERTNAVPMDAQQFAVPSPDTLSDGGYALSINDEQGLADAFAFLVSVEEGAQSVAAVCLEQDVENEALTVRFAGVDAISGLVQRALQRVTELLSGVPDQMSESDMGNELFRLITTLHFRRILARLRSSKWTKPAFLSRSHKKALWQDFDNLTHRVQFLYVKKETSVRQALQTSLESLARQYSSFENLPLGSGEEFSHLIELVRSSYDMCTTGLVRDYAQRLRSTGQTFQVRSALKTLRQIEKVAAYCRVSKTIVRASRRYPQFFQAGKLHLQYLMPYASIPTSIGYEDWAQTCHVHAEVQLVVYYDLTCHSATVRVRPPRVIGTSKYLCYLCHLFLKLHGRYPPANTHGRLYDQWTIPDLAEFREEQRAHYSNVVRAMDEEIVSAASKAPFWRPEPMTSRENLLEATGEGSRTT